MLIKNNMPSANNMNLSNGPKQKVSFKGGMPNLNQLESKIRPFDFSGYNLSLKTMAFYTFGVVLGSRILSARDKNERREILTRDAISISTIVFAVPILQKLAATMTKKGIGLPLAYWSKKPTSKAQTLAGYVNQKGNYNLATSSNVANWYTNIKDMPGKILGFCTHQDANGGNLWKTFQFLDKDSKNAINNIAKLTNNETPVKNDSMFMKVTKFLRNGDNFANIPKDNKSVITMFQDAQNIANNSEGKLLSASLNAKTFTNDERKQVGNSLNVINTALSNTSTDKNNVYRVAEFFKSIPSLMNIILVAGALGYAIPKLNMLYTEKLLTGKAHNKNTKNTQSDKKDEQAATKQPENQVQPKANAQLASSPLFAKFQK